MPPHHTAKLPSHYLSSLATVSSIGFFHTDREGQVSYVSDQWTTIAGITAEQSQRFGWLNAVHPDDRDRVRADWQRCAAAADEYIAEYRVVRPTGEIRHVQVRAAPVTSRTGVHEGFVGTVEDVTERTAEKVRQYVKRLEILGAIDRAILDAHSPESIADAAVRQLAHLFPAVRVSLAVFDGAREQGTLLAVWSRGPTTRDKGWTFSLSDAKAVVGRGEPLIMDDLSAEYTRSAIDEELFSEGVRAYVRVPLRTPDGVIGSLNISSDVIGGLTHVDLAVAQEAGDRLAVAIRNTQLLEQLRTRSRELSNLSRRLVEVQERERRDFARELHDDIGQVLTAMRLQMGALRVTATDEVAASVSQIERLVDDMVASLRRLIGGLRPPLLDELGLYLALRALADRVASQTGVAVQLQAAGLNTHRFPPDVESAAFRIVQESLTNVARHADVRTAVVRVAPEGDHLDIQVSDAGAGFAADRADMWGTGLLGMKERIALLGGTFQVSSKPGRGTIVSAQVPLQSGSTS